MKPIPIRETRIGKCSHVDDEGRFCRRTATHFAEIFQTNDHPRVGTGWFRVPVCVKHAEPTP